MARVIVTGASRGLGAAFARAFAARGDQVIGVARDRDALAALGRRLGPRFDGFGCDLSALSGCDRLVARAPACDVLVLCAGAAIHGALPSLPLAEQERLVGLNAGSVLRLVHHYVGGMRARGAGHVLTVSSTVADRGAPFLASYAAAKAFVLALSRGLAAELRGSGVSVSCLLPGPLATSFAAGAGLPARHLHRRGADPARVAEAAIEGLFRGDAVIVPGARGRAARRVKQLLPEPVWAALARRHHLPDRTC